MTGLKGLSYLDKSKDPKNPEKKTEDRDAVTFGEALVDSVYTNAPDHVELEVGTGKKMLVGGLCPDIRSCSAESWHFTRPAYLSAYTSPRSPLKEQGKRCEHACVMLDRIHTSHAREWGCGTKMKRGQVVLLSSWQHDSRLCMTLGILNRDVWWQPAVHAHVHSMCHQVQLRSLLFRLLQGSGRSQHTVAFMVQQQQLANSIALFVVDAIGAC